MVAQAALYKRTIFSGRDEVHVELDTHSLPEFSKQRNLRIAMLSYHTCPLATLGGKDTGGMNVYVRDLTLYLGRQGVHVDIFTRSQDEHVPHVLHDLGYGNRVVHVPAGPEFPVPKNELAKYIPEFVEGIINFSVSKNLSYDVIHSHYWMSGIAGLELKKIWNIPIVNMFHTLGTMKNRVAQDGAQLEGDYRIRGEKKVLKESDAIIAATPAEVAQLQWLYQVDVSRVITIPPGVDTSRFYSIAKDEAKEYIGVPPCDHMLLFVGRIEPLKGLDILLQAIALMVKDERLSSLPLCLVVIGGDPSADEIVKSQEMARVQEMSQQLGLEEFVGFQGKRSQDSLPYFYSGSEVVIVPSHYESFGMVALEAMACGTPVVASQVGGLAFLIQDGITGFHVPVGEPEALADRITALLLDRELRIRMGRQAAEFAQAYSWAIIAERINGVYQSLIE
jgi:D-inositol-3-phosphate glycosyltransferase